MCSKSWYNRSLYLLLLAMFPLFAVTNTNNSPQNTPSNTNASSNEDPLERNQVNRVQITSDIAYYHLGKKKLILESSGTNRPHILADGDSLTSDWMEYDRSNRIAYVYGHIYMLNKDKTVEIRGDAGRYLLNEEIAIITENPNVFLIEEDTYITGDYARYYTEERIAIFTKGIDIDNANYKLRGRRGILDLRSNTVLLRTNAYTEQNTNTFVRAQRIYITLSNKQLHEYHASDQMSIEDTNENYIIYGQTADYFVTNEYALVRGDPYLNLYSNDTEVWSDRIEYYNDTGDVDFLGDVISRQPDQMSFAQWATYYSDIERIHMTGNPVLKDRHSSGVTGNLIVVDVKANEMRIQSGISGLLKLEDSASTAPTPEEQSNLMEMDQETQEAISNVEATTERLESNANLSTNMTEVTIQSNLQEDATNDERQ